MKSSIGHPMAHLASLLAHIAVLCYWIVSLILCTVYAVHFKRATALRWLYSCLSGWLFTWLVLEMVKVTLSTVLELSQFYQRRKMADNSRFKDKVLHLRNQKRKKMERFARLVPGPPPLPPNPPPPEPLENIHGGAMGAPEGGGQSQ